VAENAPGDGRSIENPTDPSDMPDELEKSVRSDADHAEPVEGDHADDAGTEGETVEEPGDGLTTEQGVNEEKS
jgi:hypothetical protein